MATTRSLSISSAEQGSTPVGHAGESPDSPESERVGQLPRALLLLGFLGSCVMALAAVGAGATLAHDPLLSTGPLAWIRYGHGRQLATVALYAGLAMLIWAWIRLGRAVRARRLGKRCVLYAITAWTLPLVFAPPLFSKDIYSYLAQGDIALHGFDPYQVGPSVLSGALAENVSWVWQNTPAPYGPLFVLVAKATVAVTGQQIIPGVILIRLLMLPGFALIVWAIPRLARHFGGRPELALWFGAANPLILVHLIGGGHNDLPMVGFMLLGIVLVLERKPVSGFAMVTVAVAIKASAALVLPFLVWVWAGKLRGPAWRRFVIAAAGGIAVVAVVFGGITLLAGVDLGWIPALSSSSAIVNWLSIPSAIGQFLDMVGGWFARLPGGLFIESMRLIGEAVLAVLVIWQWWRARVGGSEAVRRSNIALLALALLGPACLPWYFSWPITLGAVLVYSGTGLVAITGASVWLVLVTYPSGDTALYNWLYVACCAVVAALAALALVRPDPLRLSAHEPDFLLARDSAAGPGSPERSA
ncbi:polyprenol phosphomannose-dependent alpha 1,6 mannosyltransferase MptB [Sciscionella sediminilitoris]|uniref:polyprenol phosphomannose-dependent alpha 1,6 mannosyltransferase MptB n=1 Tax=Sciscionella sediminilitoris TaxID=1445613 RepID=UPI00055FD4C1|nr:polyprenol phosphomannose-dependent alpha 1,6 mannosyltransferase MptB [Sciscionella sp. SE31]